MTAVEYTEVDLPEGWILVHEEPSGRKDLPHPIPVRAASIDYVRAYVDGHSTIAIQGAFLHIVERRDHVLKLIREKL